MDDKLKYSMFNLNNIANIEEFPRSPFDGLNVPDPLEKLLDDIKHKEKDKGKKKS